MTARPNGYRPLLRVRGQADIAKNLPEDKVDELVEAISGAPPNS